MDNVTTIIEYSPDVLRVDGACEMGITVVLSIAARRRDALQSKGEVSLEMSDRTNSLSLHSLSGRGGFPPKGRNDENAAQLTRNSSRMKYFARITSGSSFASYNASAGMSARGTNAC